MPIGLSYILQEDILYVLYSIYSKKIFLSNKEKYNGHLNRRNSAMTTKPGAGGGRASLQSRKQRVLQRISYLNTTFTGKINVSTE